MILTKDEILREIKVNDLVDNYIDLKRQLQPSGFDLTVKNVRSFDVKNNGAIALYNRLRKIPKTKIVEHTLLKKGAYLIDFNEIIELPKTLFALGRPRTTLLRCGCTIDSGVWDPGFYGYGQVLLVVHNPVHLLKNARVFQLQFFRCTETEAYDGVYNIVNGCL